MKRTTLGKILKGVAIGLDVGVPMIATLTQFPVWVKYSPEATMSGTFVFLSFLSVLPFLRWIKEYFKSPSVWVIWTIVLLALVVIRSIINEMIIVCFVGVIANVTGAILFNYGKKLCAEGEESPKE